MNDTSVDALTEYRGWFEGLSPERRVRMGFEMFDFARKCARAGIRAGHPDATDIEVEQRLFLRMYGSELPASDIERALARIARDHAGMAAR